MPTSPGGRFALILACVLLLFIAQDLTGRHVSAQQSLTSSKQADTSPSAARREWDARRDWTHFTTKVLGDATVPDSMKALLTSGLSPNAQDKYGRAALHAAVLLAQPELARFLLSKGADVNARDREGRTPLMVSASVGGYDHFGGFATLSLWGDSGPSRSATWRG